MIRGVGADVRGEAVGLTWECIDFKNRTVRLERNVCYTKDKGVYIDTIKNGKPRTKGTDGQLNCDTVDFC